MAAFFEETDMRRLIKRDLFWFSMLFIGLLVSGCAGTVSNMSSVPPEEVVAAPQPGKAMVVFMRPSGFGFGVQSSVFEITEGDYPSLVGIVAAKKKTARQVEPGEHLFMVIGESADFMKADVEADKTYYALVTPRMGVWKARFSLKPVHADELGTKKFNDWVDSCEWVEMNAESEQWARENMPSIISKQQEYYEDWMQKDASDRPFLEPEDGK
jgi:hypothetical protein